MHLQRDGNPNVDLLLAQHRRRWANIKSTFSKRLVHVFKMFLMLKAHNLTVYLNHSIAVLISLFYELKIIIYYMCEFTEYSLLV